MRRIALIVVVGLVVLLAGSQLLLPKLAEDRLADELRESGDVQRVSVEAFPALKLLAERADRVEVRLGSVRAGRGRVIDLVERTRGVGELDVRVDALALGRLALSELALTKRGEELEGRATLGDDSLRTALPANLDFRPVDSGDGDLVLEATAQLFGLGATVRARLAARDGGLVVAPEGLPFGGLATITVFDDPRVSISGVGAQRTGSGDGYVLTATGRLAPG